MNRFICGFLFCLDVQMLITHVSAGHVIPSLVFGALGVAVILTARIK